MLEAKDLLNVQAVSKRFLSIARENRFWRALCFDRSAKAHTGPWAERAAASFEDTAPSASLTPSGQNVLHSILNRPNSTGRHATIDYPGTLKAGSDFQSEYSSARVRAIADWDPSYRSDDLSEEVDWYSEYVGRHGQLSVNWLPLAKEILELRGMAMTGHAGDEKIIAPTEDGSVSVWDVADEEQWPNLRPFTSPPSILFPETSLRGGQSSKASIEKVVEFGGDITECVSVAAAHNRAFFATSNVVTEIDLNTLRAISQQKFTWDVTALSRTTLPESHNTIAVGTRHSLHFHDSRAQFTGSTHGGGSEERIAFIPNIWKPEHHFRLPRLNRPTRSLTVMRTGDPGEPGPVSILPCNNTLFVAGRFPSVLRYDRRFFPKLEDTIHSGGRLASLAYMPYPTNSIQKEGLGSTLLACGEYGGRGSLELYSFPRSTPWSRDFPSVQPCHTKNRQTASSSKLLSVATQGTRIVFSDADGGLKWVERDGYSLVRRWNVNRYSFLEPSTNPQFGSRLFQAGTEGADVVRKILPFHNPWRSDRGTRGDSSLLIWTGEKVGAVTFRTKAARDSDTAFHEDLGAEHSGEKEEEHNYETGMRQALQRQAEEVNWLRRFGYGR